MRISTSLSCALSASIMLAFISGCNGTGAAGGTSALAPVNQTSNSQGKSVRRLALACPPIAASAHNVILQSAGSFGVLGGSTVTSDGLSVVEGNLGVSPGTAITGFPPGIVSGTMYAGGPVAAQAQADLATAYNKVVALKNPTALPADIGGMTITPGLYAAPVSLGITGNVTLDAQGHPSSTFIFQIPSTLTTAVDSTVTLVNGASPCNIAWQVGSSATLNTASTFYGTIMAAASISLGTGSSVTGRVLAESGAVTLLDNAITVP
jgi:hypothetical protein